MAASARCLGVLIAGLGVFAAQLSAQEAAVEPPPDRGALRATEASLKSTGLDRVLLAARSNRLQLEAALRHFNPEAQPLEAAAMEWLIAHLDRHGHAQMAWFGAEGEPIEIPLEAFESEERRRAVWADLEAEHGRLRPGVFRLDGDLLSLREDELVEHVQFAVRAWRERPWTRGLDFETFCEAVLPHRVGDEALDDWRRVLFETFTGIEDRLDDPSDPHEAAEWIRRSVHTWVEFAPSYAFHLTDQSLSEMLQSGRGRGEDLAHLELMALRANAIPAVMDYTPAWAGRRGNFAWTRLLLPGPQQAAPQGRLAKVYRRTFAAQAEAWAARVPGTEPLPDWLADARMSDVTDAYGPTVSVETSLEPATRRSVLAFACVFDGQDWTPIAAGRVSDEGSQVRFENLGVGVVYLPAWYAAEGTTPAGPPFMVTESGSVRLLDGIGFQTPGSWLEQQWLVPAQPQEGYLPAGEAHALKNSAGYQLHAWIDGSWQPLQQRTARHGRIWWEIPPRRLILVQPADCWDPHARPFSAQLGVFRWW